MKASFLSMACLLALSAANAQGNKQVDYQYKNNTFSVEQQEKQFTTAGTGKLFYSRIQAFDSFNRKALKPYISRENFITYLDKFKGLTATANVNGYSEYVRAIETMHSNLKSLHKLSTGDDHRYTLYEISAPMYKVIDESWGTDLVDAVVREAYLNLYEYVNRMAASGSREFANIKTNVDFSPAKVDESKGNCQYTVQIDKPVLKKDNIEVYFSDLALFKKISKKYSGALLQGPVTGWQGMKEESDVVRALLQAYEGKKDNAYNVYGYKLKDYGNPSTVQQNLLKDQKWFVWVFRNGMLYYSYMAIPCAELSKTTVYEERPQPGMEAEKGLE